MEERPEIKIGDTYFMFDINRRVYEKDEAGRPRGSASFRGHFFSVEVKGETSRSWIVGHFSQKVPKKDPWSVLYTEDMIDDAEWINSHKYRISQDVLRVKDGDKLRQIAAIIGYKE